MQCLQGGLLVGLTPNASPRRYPGGIPSPMPKPLQLAPFDEREVALFRVPHCIGEGKIADPAVNYTAHLSFSALFSTTYRYSLQIITTSIPLPSFMNKTPRYPMGGSNFPPPNHPGHATFFQLFKLRLTHFLYLLNTFLLVLQVLFFN